MNRDSLKLTAYFGERDRVNGKFLADALSDIFSRHRLHTSVVLRGVTGFGLKHHLRSDRLLTLSEDLPLVSAAVDGSMAIEAALAEVSKLRFDGLVTLERATLLTGRSEPIGPKSGEGPGAKLTVYLGRHERVGDQQGYERVVGLLHEAGLEGAIALLGVDGTLHGKRQRAAFLARNEMVPLMIVAVGSRARVAQALPSVGKMLPRAPMTVERIEVCKREGELIAPPRPLPGRDRGGLEIWQKLMVYTGEHDRYDGAPLHERLIRELRGAGAAGATSLRGIWGFHGAREPHGDRFWQLTRRVPIVTVIVDEPERVRRWFAIADRLTRETGVVTSEIVPGFRATAPDFYRGGLRLAEKIA